MRGFDRLLTIIVTATLTSAVWIVAGGTIMQHAGIASGFAGTAVTAPAAPAARSPAPPPPPARPLAGAKLVIPVQGKLPRDLTDTFTAARAGGARIHDAIDIMAAEGTPVIAAAPGKVEKLFLSKPGGMTIYVRSPDGRMIYYYAHLRDYVPGLAEGQQVTAGQRLGSVGHTGNASPDGPHLHFALMQTTPEAKWYQPTVAINPYPLLVGR
jgi:murein DD-endopeptidase MepM/ murein hydrolase activator NlpD